jgi:hypothetical protein
MTMIEGWKIKRLDQIGDICSGSTPSTAKPEFWDGEIVWISNTLTHANNLWEAALDCRSKLLQQKTALMHDLLTGKVRVKTTPLPLRGEEAISR